MVFHSLLEKVVSFTKVDTFYVQKEQIAGTKTVMPRGNLEDVLLALYCTKKTLQNDTKTNLERNLTNGVFTVASRI
jgi:hypothetical protein